jgi:hypothetical protein
MLADRRFAPERAGRTLDCKCNHSDGTNEASRASSVFTVTGETDGFERIFIVVEDQTRAYVRFAKTDIHGDDVVACGEYVTLRLTRRPS